MSKLIYRKEKKQFFEDTGREVTIIKQREYFIKDISNDFHTENGVISKADLKKKTSINSSMGTEFQIIDTSFIDVYKRIKRIAQIIPRKDVGYLIAETGIGKGSVIVDAGSGSGGLSLFLANIAKKVTTYDIKKEHVALVNENIKFLNLKNVIAKEHNIYDGIEDKNVDVFTLDLPEPWKVLPHAVKSLKQGGFIVSYSPCIPQVADFVNALVNNENFIHIKTIEVIEREWEVSGRKVRPKSKMMGHSGFLSFVRKI
ncbi:methyltransferase domain-containing protein [Candidatus Woesearchaeota archaeon]|nr:methyltransferase domain-containing protein [Candidatus Woesearchaeota archaeon]